MKTFGIIVALLGWAIRVYAVEGPATTAANPSTKPAGMGYLFSNFHEPEGKDGLHLAWSADGLMWTPLNNEKSYLKPTVGENMMRDPSLLRGPDGVFRLVWTTSWHNHIFGYASSKDLIHWTDQKAVTVMEDDPTATNVWAPELFYDAAKQQYLIFWASTVPGKFQETANAGDANHRIYYVTTKDFDTFSRTKLLYDGGFNEIDAAMFQANGKTYMVVKNEGKTPVHKDLHLVEGDTPEGPWKKASEPLTKINWIEGPSPLKVGDWYYIYFDHYGNPPYYGGMRSKNLTTWEDASRQIHFPKGMRHGTALQVPMEIIDSLRK